MREERCSGHFILNIKALVATESPARKNNLFIIPTKTSQRQTLTAKTVIIGLLGQGHLVKPHHQAQPHTVVAQDSDQVDHSG